MAGAVGFSNSWFAVQGWTRDEALAKLDLEADREIDGWPHRRMAVGDLPSGWLIFLTDDLEEAFQSRFTGCRLVAQLSRAPWKST